MDKYISVITNFGCHYKCPYCIVRKNNLHIPETTLDGLRNLDEEILKNSCNIISISGGGDLLHNYEQHYDWYRELFKIARDFNLKHNRCSNKSIPIEMHTSYMPNEVSFPFYDCYRVVYHANAFEDLTKIHRTGSERIRVVFVVTENFSLNDIMDIAVFVKESTEIDELSFRQMVDGNYETQYFLHEYLKLGHKNLWHYIEQNDYNLYYVENKVCTRYQDFQKCQNIQER